VVLHLCNLGLYRFSSWNPSNRLLVLLEPFKQTIGSPPGTLQTDYWFSSWNPSNRLLGLLLEPFKQTTGSPPGTLQRDYLCCSWNHLNRLLFAPSTVGHIGSTRGTLQTGHVCHPLPDRSDWFCSWNPSNRLLVLLVEPFKQAMCINPSPDG
jgi:hypothetical protein